MPPKRGKRKKGKSKKEVTFGPTLAERNINAVKCSLSHFMKVEKHDIVVNVPGYSVGLRQEEESDDVYDSLQSGEEGEEDEDETRLATSGHISPQFFKPMPERYITLAIMF